MLKTVGRPDEERSSRRNFNPCHNLITVFSSLYSPVCLIHLYHFFSRRDASEWLVIQLEERLKRSDIHFFQRDIGNG